ncbi:MAG: hypothetical protein IJU48_05275 [Synergistaceae bacterium]|nr:hypothetical protein [Synergistaceae bacterium]
MLITFTRENAKTAEMCRENAIIAGTFIHSSCFCRENNSAGYVCVREKSSC